MNPHHSDKARLCIIAMTILFFSFSNFSFADEVDTKILSCRSKNHNLIKGYKIGDAEGDITIFLCDGTLVKPRKPEEQEMVSVPIVSKDQKYIGWNIHSNNCCASYPIPTSVGFYNNGKTYIVNGGGQMVSNWNYSPPKDKIILETVTTHGMNEPNIDEFDIKTGKKIRHIKDGK